MKPIFLQTILVLSLFLTVQSSSDTYTHPSPFSLNRHVKMEKTSESLFKLFKSQNWKSYLNGFSLPAFATNQKALPYVTCNDNSPHYFKFFGDTATSLLGKRDPSSSTTNSPCFSNTTISANWSANDTIEVNFNSQGKTALLCMDHYILTTLLNFDIKITMLEGNSSISYKLVNQTEIELVQRKG